MKFRVERDVLADAVAWAARSLPVRPSAPVLAGLLIEAGRDGLVLSTFDYETSARATLTAEVNDEGKALVSGRLLADICRSLPNKPVELTLDGARVSLTCGSSRFSLQTMPVEDYPTIPEMPAATGTVPSDAFAHAVAQAVTAAGRDDMLPVLTGVRLEIEGDTIALLATDRFRLSQRELTWNPGTPDATVAALVPAKVLGDTAKSLTAGPEVTIALSASGAGDGIIGFEGTGPGGVRRTTTRLLDGEFPKVRSLFPSEKLTIAKIDRQELIESVKRVSLVADRNTAVQLSFRDGALILDAGSGDDAQASESVAAEIEGDDLVTGFNPNFLLDGLGAIDEAVVELAFTQASKPVVISGTGDEAADQGGSFRYLLMPRRLLS
ncbi:MULTISPECIES: DNA polymerase III subunit beta [Pimelobacter]|uniref:DNA polymerase III subunit beta n=1 Tax=Pimelobacter TaxID=2044 RepID=UPI001C04366B|nr:MULTISPECIES: DNA polymerase III subunit beta [Pimelobacter]MBU2695646.1 DNA polymerase III subunit beta [Pimelobacter sp. 30-1]UUW90937.1 DNA polymerase III subunit beta [Pimelobacter simplex]UUW94766.1 DNA polymerase III subunit beta [Pimelobacter simplex]